MASFNSLTTDAINWLLSKIKTGLAGKVDAESGKGLSTNDYTTAEKTKLSGIAEGAEVNQNAFSNVTVGSTTIAADGKTDTLTLAAGSNITLTPDATNDKVTIAATDTTYSAATSSAAGLMSASDKTKLDAITESADSVSVSQSLTTGTKVGTITVNGTGTDLYAPSNTDTKVTNTLATTTKAYVTGTTSASTNTGTQVFDTGVYLDTTAGQLTATTFKGSLSGNATTATSATKATQDSAGNNINTTYIKSLSVSGKTVTYTKGDGTTGTITTQDTAYSTGTASTAGLTKLYTATGSNTDGTMTQSAITAAIDALPDPMVFKGSLGTDGTITSLPDASSSNIGCTYKVITAGTYASQAADVGDTFISDGSSWVLIPSGDEPSGTVTSVATGVGLTGGTITSSGTVKAKLKSESSLGSSNSITTTSGKTYAVGVDSSGYLAVNVPWTDNNTTYSAATTSAAGLMSASDKSKLDAITASADAVSFTQSLTSGTAVGTLTINGTDTTLYAPTNTDTHYTTGLKVGASATATANAAATNGNVYMNALDNTTVRDSHNIVGSGATTVTSDANGKITINSTNTTYSAATTSANGLMSSTDKKNVTYFVEGTQTAATNAWTGTLSGVTLYDGLTIRYYLPYAGTSTGATLALNSGTAYPVYRYGRSTQITTHFSAGSIITMTFRSSYSVAGTSYTNAWIVGAYYNSDGNDKVTNTLATTTKAYVTGTTSATTNTGKQVFDTGVYLDTTAGQLTATTFKGNLSGTASKATADASGNTIASTYISGLSADGTTVTYTKGDGTTGTITTSADIGGSLTVINNKLYYTSSSSSDS